MTVWEQLQEPEVKALRERYHNLTGCWVGLHWEELSTVDALKKYLREEISKMEKELGEDGSEGEEWILK